MTITLEDEKGYTKCSIEDIIKTKDEKIEIDWSKFFKIQMPDDKREVLSQLYKRKVLTLNQDNAYGITNDIGNSVTPGYYFIRKEDAMTYLHAFNKMKTEGWAEKHNIEHCAKTNKKYFKRYYLVHFEESCFDEHSKLLPKE